MRTRLTRVLLTVAAAGAIVASGLSGLTGVVPAGASTPHRIPVPAVPVDLPKAIEGYAPYQPQIDCSHGVQPGTQRLMNLLLATYPDGYDASEFRPCSSSLSSTTEHSDGRALDFGLSVTNAHQNAEAHRILDWLFATDAQGNADAMARRLGVMYVIYNARIRMVGGGWERYDPGYCWTANGKPAGDPTTCHRNHIHISLDWNGATGHTSFWTGRVAATDYGPCITLGQIFAPAYTHPNHTPCPLESPRRPEPTVAAGPGDDPVYVAAVQRVVGAKVNGRWTSSLTARLRRWQRSHHLAATGVADTATWNVINTMRRVGAP